jgi:hypothetical protein
VKTTPNPRATKKSRGELVGPPLLPSPLPPVLLGIEAVELVADIVGRIRDGYKSPLHLRTFRVQIVGRQRSVEGKEAARRTELSETFSSRLSDSRVVR